MFGGLGEKKMKNFNHRPKESWARKFPGLDLGKSKDQEPETDLTINKPLVVPWSSSSTVTLLSDIYNCRIKSKNDPTGGSEEETHYNPRGSRVSLLKLPP